MSRNRRDKPNDISANAEQVAALRQILNSRTARRNFIGGSVATAATVMASTLPASAAPTEQSSSPSLGAAGGCPVFHTTTGNRTSNDFWPEQLSLWVLHQHSALSNPLPESFNYAEAFGRIDLDVLKTEMIELMTTSQDWWPADYGHYGPLLIRMAWHSAGTYRIGDGRGGGGRGTQRFSPLDSWPDNANLDKARRLLWPIKQKYGDALSWADLMIFAGTCAIESMGLPSAGFGGGRDDVWEPDEDIFWGPEDEFLADERHNDDRELQTPLAAVQLGLIYVNPEGPDGNLDPLAAAVDIRQTFARMAMNDEETVALIAGGHTFGKCHGAVSGDLGPEPAAAPLEEQGFGWRNSVESGNAQYTNTSNLEGAWTVDPAFWDDTFFDILFDNEWMLTEAPAGGKYWIPENLDPAQSVPDAHIPDLRHPPLMLTTDLSLRFDPDYEPISRRFKEDFDEFGRVFAEAWYKLTHRDMGPRSRYVGSMVPAEARIWQDPVPDAGETLSEATIATLKEAIANSGLSTSELVSTAWASASTFRDTDKRGGANGARIRLEPQRDWEVNNPAALDDVIKTLEGIQSGYDVSLADLIVLGGSVGVEQAAQAAGVDVEVPFTPGRTDATQEDTDVESFAVLEPIHDGFRNYLKAGLDLPAEHLLVERANLLSLTAPEMTVLVGGMRMLGTNADGSDYGVFTDQAGALTTDFFVNLLDIATAWRVSSDNENLYEGYDRASGEIRWVGTAADVVFGSNAQLRALSEVYAADNSTERFVADFVEAWVKVMDLDRFDAQ